MNSVLIITGGYLNIDFAKEYIKTLSYDKVFAVDKGLEYVDVLGLIPDLIIGDFDTVNPALLEKYDNDIKSGSINANIIKHPVKKDETDTELALQCSVDKGALSITMLGATGTRLDHVLANLSFLKLMGDKGIEVVIVDENNRIRLLDSGCNMTDVTIYREKQFGRYISLIPITRCVEEVTISGVEYPLDNAVIASGKGLTVSNEITEKAARIHIGKGAALLIESKD